MICELRSYLRLRLTLVQDAARDILHMEKALEQMNIKLKQVVGDLNAAPDGFPHAERTRDGSSAFRIFDGNGRFARVPAGAAPTPADLTWPAAAPDRVLDWILVPAGWQQVGYRAVPSLLSDHVPLVTDVVLPSEAAAP